MVCPFKGDLLIPPLAGCACRSSHAGEGLPTAKHQFISRYTPSHFHRIPSSSRAVGLNAEILVADREGDFGSSLRGVAKGET